jgi:hypothetical protein
MPNTIREAMKNVVEAMTAQYVDDRGVCAMQTIPWTDRGGIKSLKDQPAILCYGIGNHHHERCPLGQAILALNGATQYTPDPKVTTDGMSGIKTTGPTIKPGREGVPIGEYKSATMRGFNPSGSDTVDEIKKLTDELITLIESRVPNCRARNIAKTNYQQAAMWAVRGVFDHD